jgi:hypothetical protein
MNQDTAVLIEAIDTNLRTAEQVASHLSRQQFNWRSEPGRWSIAQCLGHLNILSVLDLAPLDALISDGHERGIIREGPFHYGYLSRKFAASQDLPVKSKFKAPKKFAAPSDMELSSTVAEYRRVNREIRRLVLAADGLDWSGLKIGMSAMPGPMRALFRMPLGARLALLVNHDRRHLWQAGQVRAHADFPK